ncbi:MAG TPA: hypothetical protein PKA19_06520 [Bacillota bacterium]|nr:hypothetical protein [Bacillota bacterium]
MFIAIENLKKSYGSGEGKSEVLKGISLTFVLGLIIIYLVTGLVVDESRTSISLMKVFGYRKRGIGKLILGFLVVLAAYESAKYHRLAFLHTYANKSTGIVLFFFPFLFWVFGEEITAIAICCIASISAVEEFLINLTSKTLDRDRGSIFIK